MNALWSLDSSRPGTAYIGFPPPLSLRCVHLSHLTPTEYQLLKVFVAHPNKILTDLTLLREVWGPDYESEAHYLHVYVARLRKKLEVDPQAPRFVVTEPGVGYRLLAEEA